MDPHSKHELDNHSDILNPNNDAYWKSRGYEGRSDDQLRNHYLDDDDDDDDNDERNDDSADDRWGDDSESFHEEWVPQDAW